MDNIICIAGPTASGKTALSIALALRRDAEIVSCDSMQVYRRMDIGTAKPTEEEKRGITHHMLDVAEPDEDFSVSKYCTMATPIVEDILARGKTAIIVGGTGLYMDALIQGNSFAPSPSTGRREELEHLADQKGINSVRELLRSVDPDSAARIPPADRKRIIRAMEIFLETGETMTEHDRRTRALPPRFHPIWFGLEDEVRQDLYNRIDARVLQMLDNGLIDEIRSLLEQGISPKATALQAIGYKEFIAALEGQCSIEEAAAQVQQASRRYAKRQLTWFRRNSAMHWLRRTPATHSEEIVARAEAILQDSTRQL